MVLPLELSIGATAVLMVVGWAIFRNAKAVGLRSRLATMTTALNLITAVLVVMNVVPIVMYRPPRSATAASKLTGQFVKPLAEAKNGKHPMPDIYYIMPEDYGDEITLRDGFGLDTHGF